MGKTIQEALQKYFPDAKSMMRMVMDGNVIRNGEILQLHDLPKSANYNSFQFGKVHKTDTVDAVAV